MARNERFQLRDDLGLTPECEIGLDPVLERRDVELVEPGDLVLREALVREIRQRRPSPEREGAPQLLGRLPGLAGRERGSSLGQTAFEAVAVELVRLDPKRIAAANGAKGLGAAGQLLPEGRNTVLQHLRSGLGRVLSPELVDDHVARHRLVAAQEQAGQHRPLPRPAQGQAALAVEHLQGPEDAVVHRVSL